MWAARIILSRQPFESDVTEDLSNPYQASNLTIDGYSISNSEPATKAANDDLFTEHARHSTVSLLPNGTTRMHALDFLQFSTQIHSPITTSLLSFGLQISRYLDSTIPAHPTLQISFLGEPLRVGGARLQAHPLSTLFYRVSPAP